MNGRFTCGFLYRSQNKPYDNIDITAREIRMNNALTMIMKRLMICCGYPSISRMKGYTTFGGGAMIIIIYILRTG